jgi:DNA-binding response OmpR family regulator
MTQNIITYKNSDYRLTSQEVLFLDLLLKNRHRTVSSVEIMENVWRYDEGTESALKSLLNKVRKKIGKESIVNISGIGYRIILD